MTASVWSERRVVAFAHQGGSHEAPSSTLFAIEQSLAAGATAIELDVHATKDRHIVVCHDETVDRTTSASGQICDLTLAQLRELDFAYWFTPGSDVKPGLSDDAYIYRGRAASDPRFSIATLAEVSEAFPGVPLNMDIKRTSPEVEPYEQLLADELRRLDRRDSVIVASFNDLALGAFRDYAPEFLTSGATAETAEFYFASREGRCPDDFRPVALQVPADWDGITVVDEAFVDTAHRHGIAVHVWTINEVAEMNRLVDLGVDGIITDRPSELVSVLTQRGVAWDGRP
jgi:glycerophosphoryl diester phosphodiesterase